MMSSNYQNLQTVGSLDPPKRIKRVVSGATSSCPRLNLR